VPDAPWVINADFLKKWDIDYVAHDEDPYSAVGHEDVYSHIKSQGKYPRPLIFPPVSQRGCAGKFLPTRRTPGVSTSELLERIVSGYRKRDFDEKLTKMGHAELRAEGSDFDERG
jgi:choline-phosphate cytidylyltransferase